MEFNEKIAVCEQRILNLEKEMGQLSKINENFYNLSGDIKGLIATIESQNKDIVNFKEALNCMGCNIDKRLTERMKSTDTKIDTINKEITDIKNKQTVMENSPAKTKFEQWSSIKTKVIIGVLTSVGVSIIGGVITIISYLYGIHT